LEQSKFRLSFITENQFFLCGALASPVVELKLPLLKRMEAEKERGTQMTAIIAILRLCA
jgi:hypothetical protein